MTCKFCLYLLFVFLSVNTFAQNKQILYNFDQLPQTLMLNPGAEVDYNKHFGIPLLSSVYFQIGATNKDITYNNTFAETDDFGDVLRNVYEQNSSSSDYFLVNQQLEILNAGFRLKDSNYYLSFGMYEEFDGFATYPNDLVNLYYEGDDKNRDGIPEQNVVTNFDEVNIVGELVGVFHIGLSKKVNDKLNIGARLKFISGSLNLNSKNNSGTYHLENLTSLYHHQFTGLGAEINTSGLLNSDASRISKGGADILQGLFFIDGNIGLGVDLGFTYHATESITVTASLLDLDYVKYSNEISTFKVKTDFDDTDATFYDPPGSAVFNYWENTLDLEDLENSTKVSIESGDYNTFRSPKLNASVKYRIINSGETNYNSVFRDSRFVTPTKGVVVSEFGIHTYTAFRPNKIDWALTAFYSREINKYLNTKITYTYSKFSSKNIGLGISTHFNKINFYATADNLLNLFKIKDSNYQSFQFGMNFIFK